MSTEQANRLLELSQTAPTTLMGGLLRKFWHPVAISSQIAVKKTKHVRVLSEDLAVYRGESGQPYCISARCAHRRTLLHTGWVEGEELRCIYHGWKYNGAGQCVERPAEANTPLKGIKIPGYQTREYCGLIFAYLGEGEAPPFELPRRTVYEDPKAIHLVRSEHWPCNWFQQVENTMDAVHVSFVHQYGRVGAFGHAVTETLPKTEYIEIESGLRQIASRGSNNIRVGDLTFPNNNNVVLPNFDEDKPWQRIGVWVVPNDDTSTTRFYLHCVQSTTPEADAEVREHFKKYAGYAPINHHDELFQGAPMPEDPIIQITSAQDYLAIVGQGPITDRTRELLGKSDIGIAKLRRLFFRELDALREGRPLTAWRMTEAPAHAAPNGLTG